MIAIEAVEVRHFGLFFYQVCVRVHGEGSFPYGAVIDVAQSVHSPVNQAVTFV